MSYSTECINYNGEDLDIPATGEATQRAWDEVLLSTREVSNSEMRQHIFQTIKLLWND